tara:strand:- start:14702 stop:15883 length:1182 start_codon:yes stop_codon:yes gene_type:complete
MAYFNHAYVKGMLATSIEDSDAQATTSLGKAELGLVDASDYQTVAFPTSAAAGNIPAESMLVLGNYNQTDTLGSNPKRGGYAESIKTKIIKKNYITGLWSAPCVTTAAEYIEITIPDGCFKCDGSTADQNQLRIDIKGDEALRFLNRFSYAVLDYRECCASGADVPGATVVAAWVDRINEDPLLNPFMTASAVSGGSTDNKLKLVIDYTATFFDNCSYDTRDHYGVAPLRVSVSPVDDDGNACTNTCMTAAVSGVSVSKWGEEEAFAIAVKKETTGEQVIEYLILDGRYRQDGGWNQGNKDSARIREIQHGDELLKCGASLVDRAAFYKVYYIQHSVPRFNNPTGVFDNDQYLYKIFVPCLDGSDPHPNIAKMEHLMDSYAAASGVTYTEYAV